jgi:hypothetical protein
MCGIKSISPPLSVTSAIMFQAEHLASHVGIAPKLIGGVHGFDQAMATSAIGVFTPYPRYLRHQLFYGFPPPHSWTSPETPGIGDA